MPQFPLTVLDVDVDVDVEVEPDAEQLAVVPPLAPLQLHVHGPEPATDDDVPTEQRLVEGAADTVVPFNKVTLTLSVLKFGSLGVLCEEVWNGT